MHFGDGDILFFSTVAVTKQQSNGDDLRPPSGVGSAGTGVPSPGAMKSLEKIGDFP